VGADNAAALGWQQPVCAGYGSIRFCVKSCDCPGVFIASNCIVLNELRDPTCVLLLQAALVGAVACLSSMIGYCAYSVLYPQLQQRRIDAARRKRFRMVAVQVRLMMMMAAAAAGTYLASALFPESSAASTCSGICFPALLSGAHPQRTPPNVT
jgi:drug/metabolite transporter (DMT)-like permease